MLFRKIHGRVIPIREKGEQSNSSKAVHTALGAGAVTGGLALGSYAANKAADLTVKSAYAEDKARRYGAVAKMATRHSPTVAGQATVKSFNNYQKSKKLLNQSFRVNFLGAFGAGALVGYGANKIISQTKYKNDPEKRITAAAGAGAVTAFAMQSRYLRGIGNRKRDAIKQSIKLATSVFRKIKGL